MKFFHSALSFLEKVFTNTDWTHAAQVGITVAAPLIETVATLAGGPQVGAEVTNIVNTVKTDFGVVSVTLGQIQAGNTSVSTVTLLKNTLGAIKTNLAQLLTVADINDAATKQTVTLTVNTIVGEIDAVLDSIPATLPAPAAVPAKAA
jgi:hypothetical protein